MKKSTLIVSLILFICSVCCAQTGGLNFTVLDAVTASPQNATITITSSNYSESKNSVNGVISFTPPAGKYDVTVSALNHNTQTSNYTIKKDEVLTIHVLLQPTSPKTKSESFISTKGLISGYIYDKETLLPIANAKITVDITQEEASTNKDGYFILNSNPYKAENNGVEKRFNLTITKDGFKILHYNNILLTNSRWEIIKYLEKGGGTITIEKETNSKIRQPENSECCGVNESMQNETSADIVPHCTPPPIIRVQYNGSGKAECPYVEAQNRCVCSNMPVIAQMEMETYVQRGIDDEWNMGYKKESIKAGTVAYRTIGSYYVRGQFLKSPNFDIKSSTCNQVWEMDISTEGVNDAIATTGEILIKKNGLVPNSEFSKETNKHGCQDGYTGDGDTYPCHEDKVCKGHYIEKNNHGRGMCQDGSNRWAGGENSGENKDYIWILDHYYNPGGIFRCNENKVNIAFVIDDTYSMTNDLQAVKQGTLNIINDPIFIANSPGKLFQLTTFKDDVFQYEPTTDLDVLKSEINGLFASGGDDCPEASVKAVDVAQQNMSYGGRIYFATDADSHTDVPREQVNQELLDKNITKTDILTSECDIAAIAKGDKSSIYITPTDAISASNNNTKKSSSAATSDVYKAIETFSYMTYVTGGAFAFIPEIKTGSAEAFTRYENTWFNMVLGSVAPSIAFVNPTHGELGSKLALTVNGISTHFNPSTSISFSDPGITVESVTVLSPTQLQALITIDKNVTTNFKDLTATTTLTKDSNEIAKGKGILQITLPSFFPTVLSIAPYSATQGQNVTVQITGINTHFNNSSILNMGDGINVLKVNALSSEMIEADIDITIGAIPGYRDVTVTTGSETARETIPGPFLVIHSDCDVSGLDLGPDITLDNTKQDSSCATLYIKGIEKDSLSNYSFLWSTGETTPTIQVCPDSTTSYGVTVLKGTCKFTDEINVIVKNNNKPQLSVMDLQVSEDQSIAFVKVKLSNPSNQIVFAKYTTTDSTAKKGQDYNSINGFVAFIPHVNTTAVIPVRILHKTKKQEDKYFKVELNHATHADIADGLAVVTIESGNSTQYVSSRKISVNSNVQQLQNKLQINVIPNPTPKSFKVSVIGINEKERINIAVYDAVGALIEKRSIINGQTIEIGNNFKPGLYLLRAMQGTQTALSKAIKISN